MEKMETKKTHQKKLIKAEMAVGWLDKENRL